MMRKFLLFGLIIFLSLGLKAQDKIYRKNGKIIASKVKEVGADEVKYVLYSDTTGTMYIMDKAIINKIEFENGEVQKFSESTLDPEYYIGQKKHAIKLNFLSPIFGYTQFAYEQSIKPGTSFELGLGIIGLGRDVDNYRYNGITKTRENIGYKASGAFITASYKFLKIAQIIKDKKRNSHILSGSYIRPEVIFGGYIFNKQFYEKSDFIQRQKVYYGGLIVNFGKQWVISNRFLIDIYTGIGGGFDGNNDNLIFGTNYGLISLGGENGTLILNGGFRIGYLF